MCTGKHPSAKTFIEPAVLSDAPFVSTPPLPMASAKNVVRLQSLPSVRRDASRRVPLHCTSRLSRRMRLVPSPALEKSLMLTRICIGQACKGPVRHRSPPSLQDVPDSRCLPQGRESPTRVMADNSGGVPALSFQRWRGRPHWQRPSLQAPVYRGVHRRCRPHSHSHFPRRAEEVGPDAVR